MGSLLGHPLQQVAPTDEVPHRRRRHAAAGHRPGDPGRRATSRRTRILGVVGPAGSQEVQVSTAPFKNGGLGFVSGSATRTSLTTDGRGRGYFFRVVPNDDQQGPRVANYIRGTLRHTRVAIVDAQNSYSTGLSDTVQRILRAAGRQRAARVGERGRHDGLLVARGADSGEHAVGLHPVAAGSQGPAVRAGASQPAGKRADALRLGRAVRPGQLQDPGVVSSRSSRST